MELARGLAVRTDVDLVLVTRRGDAAALGARGGPGLPRRPRAWPPRGRAVWSPSSSASRQCSATSVSTSTTVRTTRCQQRAPVPCAVTVHDCTFFDHPEWHQRSKVVFFRRAIRRAGAPGRRRRVREPGHRGAAPPLVRGPGPGGGGTPRRRPRPLHARRAVARSGRGRPGARRRAGGPTAGRLRRDARAAQGRGDAGVVVRPGGRRPPRRRPRPRRAAGVGSPCHRARPGGGAPPRSDSPDRLPARRRRSRPAAPGGGRRSTRPSKRGSGCPPSRRSPAARRS